MRQQAWFHRVIIRYGRRQQRAARPSAGRSPPPLDAVEGTGPGECNRQAEAQDMTGEARNIWIAACLKQEKARPGGK